MVRPTSSTRLSAARSLGPTCLYPFQKFSRHPVWINNRFTIFLGARKGKMIDFLAQNFKTECLSERNLGVWTLVRDAGVARLREVGERESLK